METKKLFEGDYLRLLSNRGWEYVERLTGKHVVYIIPVTKNSLGEAELVFIREYRIPLDNYVIGFPAGLVGDVSENEDIREAAMRELEEETGYKAGQLTHLMSGPSSSGLSTEQIHFFLATDLDKVGEGGGDETENIDTINIPLHEAEEQLTDLARHNQHEIDIKSYIGLYWVKRLMW